MAFEVDLKICDHNTLPGTSSEWETRFTQSSVYKDYGNNANVNFNHIYLDLQRMFAPMISMA